MSFYLLIYLAGILLIVLNFRFLPKTFNKLSVMLGLHLALIVPSSFYIAMEFTKSKSVTENFWGIGGTTILLSIVALLLAAGAKRLFDRRSKPSF